MAEGDTAVNLPIVDFCACALSNPLNVESDGVRKTVQELTDGLEKYGCVYLVNHGMDTQDIADLRDVSRQFFNLPHESKKKCVRRGNDAANGWVADQIEHFGDKPGDLKEAFSINLAGMDNFPWPDEEEIPGFRTTNRNFIRKLNLLARRLFRLLGLHYSKEDPTLFTRAHKDIENAKNNVSCMRNLYYPAMSKYTDLQPGQMRCAPHTDFGTFTFLLQDQTGGLQIQSREGEWFDALPLEGAIMVQAADMLEIWTAGKIKAATHRVVNPPAQSADRARESTVYFVQPDDDFLVQCLDGSQDYKAVTSAAYIPYKIRLIQGSDQDVQMKMAEN